MYTIQLKIVEFLKKKINYLRSQSQASNMEYRTDSEIDFDHILISWLKNLNGLPIKIFYRFKMIILIVDEKGHVWNNKYYSYSIQKLFVSITVAHALSNKTSLSCALLM